MAEYQYLQLEYRDDCATVWLNRPERHNAFHAELIAELQRCVEQLSKQPTLRAIVLAGRGASFCAGADLQWMQQQAAAGYQANLQDARRLAQLLRTLAQLSKPLLARVHGVALGGGLGLVATCDIAIGSREAQFATSEVRLGLTPSTIAPYVLAAIGERAARRYFQTGERFGALEALRIGLLHEVVEGEALEARVEALLGVLRGAAPQAQAHCKQLLAQLRGRDPAEAAVLEQTAQSIASVRAGGEAQEGMAAFLAKRRPSWAP
jgi:methylglutaconyl-CoA hydratase